MLVDLNSALKNGYLLSYLKDNTAVWQIYHNQQYQWLLMNNTVQSVMDKQLPALLTLPHQQPLKSLVDEIPINAKVLELGLGGASNARYIKQQKPDCQITIIEQSSVVINWCERYFNPHKCQFNIIQQSAEQFILADQNQYDLIITDLFKSESSVLSYLDQNYFLQLKRILKPNGFAYLNFVPDTDHEPQLIKTHLAHAGFDIQWGEKIIGFKNWVFLLKNNKFKHQRG
ncbi:fused MFS/spermidine synthase [Catenovulum sp. 2E275]|uniref:spermidine synthase n=1 Tax=Catenovulum sp. 2E275 TaxID=2980497 RepID=UPI0021D20EFD|nr:fused MFS/spermidine synthase [Catenovulum sp. 2E275]MCU4675856.1 fused MFS/spermidine synthase [Catenovulum sp. 2E275]